MRTSTTTMFRRFLPAILLAASLTAEPLLAEERPEAPSPAPILSVGDRAPAFFLNAVNPDVVGQRRIVLEDFYRDEDTKAVIISFFATWCAPCKKELPLLQVLWERYRDDGLRIVVISIDREPEAVAGLNGFIEDLGVRYPVVSDRFAFLARRYLGPTSALPSIFITDGNGVLQTIKQGYGDDAEAFLEAEVRRVMGLGAEDEVTAAPPAEDEETEAPPAEE